MVESFLIAIGIVIVFSLVLSAYDRWVQPRLTRRWINKKIKEIESGKIPHTPHPARLELRDDRIRYLIDGWVEWELSLSDVRVLGEMTNDHGPFVDDYFFCFATDQDSWHQASFYAEGREKFLQSLERALECELTLKLVGSTDYASNVLWPRRLAGTPMFSFEPVEPTTWVGRIIGKLTGPWRNTQCFSDAVLAELNEVDGAAASRRDASY